MKYILSLSFLAVATAPLAAQDVFGRNLIVNGDAESGPGAEDDSSTVLVPGWSYMTDFTAVEYGAAGDFPTIFSAGPSKRGSNFFAGGPVAFAVGTAQSVSTATQMADVAVGADQIDVGLVQYELKGYLGGWQDQDDNAVLTVEFLDDVGTILGSGVIGPVLALDRGGVKGMLLRSTSGPVPLGTRQARITLKMTRVERVGQLDMEYNDGYADELSLVLTAPPEPTEFKLTAGDAASFDRLGTSVALSGETALVGADMDDGAGSFPGSAYVFVRDDLGMWQEQVELAASDAAPGDLFGASVAVSGDIALVGAPMDDDAGNASGSAYVFVRDDKGTADKSDDTWSEQAKLTAGDAAEGDQFGTSVALGGSTALVGSPMDDDAGSDSGAVYVFVRNSLGTWQQQTKLTADDAAADDRFGTSVGMSGETAVVGAPMDDDTAGDSGSAYVFVRGGTIWIQQDKVTASDAGAGDLFGTSVGVSVDTVLVGAPMDDDAGGESGSAYAFTRNVFGNWIQQDKLTAADAAAGDQFGMSVKVSGEMGVVGAPMDDDAGGESGSAYVFTQGLQKWRLQNKLRASDAEAGDVFGSAVAMSGGTALIGAPGEDEGGDGSGAAYLYETAVVEYGVGHAGSGGIVPRIGTGGSIPQLGNPTFRLKITNAVGGTPCVIAGSFARDETVLYGGVLYGDFLTPGQFVALSFLTSGLAGIPGIGTATLPVPIPNDAALIGLSTYWQGFVSDPASSLPLGVSHTGGLAVTVIR